MVVCLWTVLIGSSSCVLMLTFIMCIQLVQYNGTVVIICSNNMWMCISTEYNMHWALHYNGLLHSSVSLKWDISWNWTLKVYHQTFILLSEHSGIIVTALIHSSTAYNWLFNNWFSLDYQTTPSSSNPLNGNLSFVSC